MPMLREARASQLLTIRGLAQKAGVATRTIVQIEAGEIVPRFATIRKIADALGVPPAEITEFAAAIDQVAHPRATPPPQGQQP